MTRNQVEKALLTGLSTFTEGIIALDYAALLFNEKLRTLHLGARVILRGKEHFDIDVYFYLYLHSLSKYSKYSPAYNPHAEVNGLNITVDIGYMRYKKWDKASAQKPQCPLNSTEIGFPCTAQGVEQAVELLRGDVYTCFREFTDKYSDLNTLEEIINREMDVLWHVLKHPPFDRAVLGIVLAKKCGKDYHKTAQRYEEYLKEKNLTWQGRNMPLEFIPELVNTLDRE